MSKLVIHCHSYGALQRLPFFGFHSCSFHSDLTFFLDLFLALWFCFYSSINSTGLRLFVSLYIPLEMERQNENVLKKLILKLWSYAHFLESKPHWIQWNLFLEETHPELGWKCVMWKFQILFRRQECHMVKLVGWVRGSQWKLFPIKNNNVYRGKKGSESCQDQSTQFHFPTHDRDKRREGSKVLNLYGPLHKAIHSPPRNSRSQDKNISPSIWHLATPQSDTLDWKQTFPAYRCCKKKGWLVRTVDKTDTFDNLGGGWRRQNGWLK